MFEQWENLWSKSNSSFDLTVKLSVRLWHYLPKDQLFCLLMIFYTKDCNSVDQSRNCRCERQLPPHYLKSVELSHGAWGRAVLTSAPELQTRTHNTQPHGWIPALSSPQQFTCTGYVTLQDLSQNAKLISYVGFTTLSSSCRYNIISEARVKLLKKSTVTATTTEQIKIANNILFAHCFKTGNTKLLPCSLRSNELKHLVQVLRTPWHCSQEVIFLFCLTQHLTNLCFE